MKIINNVNFKNKKTGKAEEDNEEKVALSDEEAMFLYDKAVFELNILNEKLNSLLTRMDDSFCGGSILGAEQISSGLYLLNEAINIIIPAILKGDYDKIRDKDDSTITDEAYDAIRENLYINLIRKYKKLN